MSKGSTSNHHHENSIPRHFFIPNAPFLLKLVTDFEQCSRRHVSAMSYIAVLSLSTTLHHFDYSTSPSPCQGRCH
ncbi:hypothetical protein ARMGADRAFT_1004831 [Armillaria gallica]|uniref:Uncharacterized protein n=1 Tax=Armillaria gallica TaxID=47427 RepID=A0A2H3EV31_ARMGA|nr:hypothetical protein ARMGADRAFT_1004831 [Armillaria gallica]